MLRRHLYHSHNDLSREEANQIFEKAVRKHSKMSPVDDIDINVESSPLYSKVEPDGRIKCKAPDCEMMVSAQNIARYVRKQFKGRWSHFTFASQFEKVDSLEI